MECSVDFVPKLFEGAEPDSDLHFRKKLDRDPPKKHRDPSPIRSAPNPLPPLIQAMIERLFFHREYNYACEVWIWYLSNQNHIKHVRFNCKPASWSSGNAFVSGAGGLRFKSRVGQIVHSAADDLPALQYFFDSSCIARAQWREDGPPPTRYTLRRNTASIMKDLILIWYLIKIHKTSASRIWTRYSIVTQFTLGTHLSLRKVC